MTTKFAATIVLFHASVEVTANTNPGRFLVQISGSSSGNEDWATIHEFDAITTTPNDETMTATEPIGETALTVASTGGFAANDILYIQDVGTVADGEWGRCREINTDTTIDLVDGLTNAKDSADHIWNDGDIFVTILDLTSVGRVRVVFQHEGATGANCHIKGLMITGDSIA